MAIRVAAREASGRMLRACRDAPATITGRPFLPPTLAFAALGGRTEGDSRAPVERLRATPTEVQHAASFCSSSLRDVERDPIWAAEAARAPVGRRIETASSAASAEFQQPLQRLRHVLRDPDRLRLTTPSQYRDPALPLPQVRQVDVLGRASERALRLSGLHRAAVGGERLSFTRATGQWATLGQLWRRDS